VEVRRVEIKRRKKKEPQRDGEQEGRREKEQCAPHWGRHA